MKNIKVNGMTPKSFVFEKLSGHGSNYHGNQIEVQSKEDMVDAMLKGYAEYQNK